MDVEDNLGGTQVCYEALQAGEIDIYLDYTGTVYVSLLNHPAKSDMEAVYQECKDELAANYDIVVLDKSPLNNTYTIAVQKPLRNMGLSPSPTFRSAMISWSLGPRWSSKTGLMMGCRVWWPSTDSSLRIP